MAEFTNTATLSYNNQTVNSNVVTGEILEVLTASKHVVSDDYRVNDTLTYVINIVNSGATPMTGLTVSDDLGAYTRGTMTLVPLTYVTNSLQYYSNGILQTTPPVTAGPPLTITRITVPAGGNATLIYQAVVNQYAPLSLESAIINTATITGGTQTITATATVDVASSPNLSITKTLCPQTVTADGRLNYTFTIQNTGNTPATSGDNVAVTDTFNPILSDLAVALNGTEWTENNQYTYDESTGLFSTVAGQITVPAATYTQSSDGTWVTTPGVATLTVSGTV